MTLQNTRCDRWRWGRKNGIHVGNRQPAPRVAAVLSIVETCSMFLGRAAWVLQRLTFHPIFSETFFLFSPNEKFEIVLPGLRVFAQNLDHRF